MYIIYTGSNRVRENQQFEEAFLRNKLVSVLFFWKDYFKSVRLTKLSEQKLNGNKRTKKRITFFQSSSFYLV